MSSFKKIFIVLIISILQFSLLSNCTTHPQHNEQVVQDTGNVIKKVGDIPLPKGFTRMKFDSMDIANYLQQLSFKQDNNVYLYDGSLKSNQRAQYAVLDIDIGNRDLQQCADATMRLRAEHLFKTKQFDDIAFHFTSGHLASWKAYADGYRPKISGNSVTWVKTQQKDTSYANFRRYMDVVFTYCGTKSMAKEVRPIAISDIQPGDVFHVTGNPYGHAVTVMDVAKDTTGQVVFLLSQSYMPAQNIHILVNPNDKELSPWYTLKEGMSLITPEWVFPPNSLKRWKN